MTSLSLADPQVQECPLDYYRQLHQRPVYLDPGLGFFVCGHYATARQILRDTDTFSNVGSQTMDGFKPPPAEVLALRRQMVPIVDTLVTNDPPSHTRVRSMMDAPFRPRAVALLRPKILAIIDETIDAFVDQRECEFVSAFAIPVPIKVIADLLGIPRSLAPDIKAWSDAAVEPLGMMISDERHVACARLTLEFQRYFANELKERAVHPKDDLLTHLVLARDDAGVGFSLAEMLSLCSQLLVAGNETTTNGLSAGMQLLIDNPDQLAALSNAPEGDLQHARILANDVLRLESPVQGLFRVVRRQVQLGDVTLPVGARIMVRFAAANRDPAQYTNPDRLDVCRANAGTHVAFGAGIHHCIGANLAREEMTLAFDRLVRRLTDCAYLPGENDFKHHPSLILRGLDHLNISFRQRA